MDAGASEDTEDRLAARAEDLDVRIAAGETSPAIALESLCPGELSTLLAAQECLLRLEQVWPRGGSHPATAAGMEAGPDAGPDIRPPSGFGRFRIVRELGRGGSGVVFLAIDPELDRPVALKLPRADWLLGDRGRELFVREARAVAALDHPNIAPLYEAGEVHGVCYLASAYCDGPSLADWLRERGGRLDPRMAARIVADLADAIRHAHDRGILHRDLKPSNILLQHGRAAAGAPHAGVPTADDGHPEFQPRVVDFGLARVMDGPGEDVTASFTVAGSAPYMAPEQAEGKKVGPGVDIYGLGAILYAILCGRPPHRGSSELDTMRRVVADEIVPPRRLRRDLARDLEAICLRCLEKDPARRFPDAGALAEDLRRFLAGQPTRARPPGRWEVLRREGRRHPVAVAVLVIGAVLTGAALGGGYWLKTRLEQTRSLARRQDEEARRRVLDVRRARYIADVRQGAQFARNGRINLALDRLMRLRPQPGEDDLREFVWYHLLRRCHTERATLAGHRGDVYHAEFSPDGKTLASSGLDGTVRLWDPTTGSLIRAFQAHEAEVNWVSFSPDGRTLATASDDGTVRLWDRAGGHKLIQIAAHRGIAVVVLFTPDGRRLVSCGRDDGDVKTWDAGTGRLLSSFSTGLRFLDNMALSREGSILAVVGSSEIVTLRDLATGGRVASLRPHVGDAVQGVAFSHDGTMVATGCKDGIVRLWRVKSGSLVRECAGHTLAVQSVSFSPDDRALVSTGDDNTIRLWDAATGAPRGLLLGHVNGVWGVSHSPDGRTIASASRDGTVKLWDVRAFEAVTRLSMRQRLEALTFADDSRTLIAIGADGRVPTWDVGSGTLRGTGSLGDPRSIVDVALAGDGSLVAVSKKDGCIDIHDLIGGGIRETIGPVAGGVVSMELDRDARRLAVVVATRGVSLWSLGSAGRPALLEGSFTGTAFTPDGGILCIGNWSEDLIAWNPATGLKDFRKSVPSLRWNASSSIRMSPDGKLFAATSDREVGLWGRESLERVGRLDAHTDRILTVAFSPDGKTLASGGSRGSVKLCDVASREELLSLEAHAGPVRLIQFSPDGKTLAACADRPDGTTEIVLWRTAGL